MGDGLVAGDPEPAVQPGRRRGQRTKVLMRRARRTEQRIVPVVQGVADPVGGRRVDHQHQHAPVAFGAVGDLEVVDVDPHLPEQGGDLGQDPGPVGDRHPDLGRGLARRRPGRQVDPGLAGPLEQVEQQRPVARRPPGRGPPRGRASSRSRTSRIPARFSTQTSGQMPGSPAAMRVMSRNPPAARRSRVACSRAVSAARFIRVAAVRCGTWDTMATRSSWRAAGSSTTLAPEGAHRGADRGEGHRVGVGRRGEHPGGPLEHVGVGAVDALLLGAGHGMAADEAGVVELGDDRALDAGHVGDHAGRASRASAAASATAPAGVATKVTSGRRVGRRPRRGRRAPGPGLRGPGRGRARSPASPAAAGPEPMEPPMSPVPTIWARAGGAAPAGHRRSTELVGPRRSESGSDGHRAARQDRQCGRCRQTSRPVAGARGAGRRRRDRRLGRCRARPAPGPGPRRGSAPATPPGPAAADPERPDPGPHQAVAPDGRRRRTCAAPGGCGPRGW